MEQDQWEWVPELLEDVAFVHHYQDLCLMVDSTPMAVIPTGVISMEDILTVLESAMG
jgi:hypothetical protein